MALVEVVDVGGCIAVTGVDTWALRCGSVIGKKWLRVYPASMSPRGLRCGLLGGLLLAAAETLLRYLPAHAGTDLSPAALLPVVAGTVLALPAGVAGLLHPAAAVAMLVGCGVLGGGVIGGVLAGLAAGLAMALSRSGAWSAAAIAALLLSTLPLRASPVGECEAPVVVLAVMDTVGAQATSLHGAALATTPGLEALAARGTWFSEAISPAPWTLPAHAAMFTGRLPRSIGAHHEQLVLSADVTTLAQRLSAAGWRTGAFVANPWIARETGMTRGFSHQEHHSEISAAAVRFSALSLLPVRRNKGGRGLVKRALAWTGRCAGQPTFVFLNLLEAHSPFHQNADADRFGVDEPVRISQRMAAVQLRGPAGVEGFPEPGELDAARRLYAAGVAEADARVAELAAALPRASMVVTADHGEAFGEHGFYGHMIGIHREVLQVPLVVVGPQVPAQRIDEPTSTMRVHDTVLALAGLPGSDSLLSKTPDAPVLSEQLRPILKLNDLGEQAEGWMDSRQSRAQIGAQAVVRREPVEGAVQWHRYDLLADPLEQNPLPLNASHSVLKGLLSDMIQQPIVSGFELELDGQMRAQLHALGYVEP